MWDTAGQEQYAEMNPFYFRGADACIVVYDVTSEMSLRNCEKWITKLRENAQLKQNFPIFLTGNKADLNSVVKQ